MLHFDTIVIGAGVAGMTSAIYLKRANLNVLILEKSVPGGQINKTQKIENYPGFKSIDGPSLAMNIYEQVSNLDIKISFEDVKEIEKEQNLFIIKTNQNEYEVKSIIIATGRIPLKLGLENENNLIGHGISYCALCDGIFYKDMDVAIVGGGNSALTEALYLSDICRKVYIIHRRNVLKADAILQEKINMKSNIFIKYNVTIKEAIENENKLSKIILSDNQILQIDGLFIYIGNIPDTKFLKKININLDNDYIVVDKNMKTNIDLVYACGDVIKKDVYQISTAVGEAATAATNIIKFLKEK